MMRKQHYSVLACLLLLVQLGARDAASETQVFKLKIVPPKGSQKAGTNLKLLVTVTNTSGRNLTFITSPGLLPEDDSFYKVSVQDEWGRQALPATDIRTHDKRVSTDYGSRIGLTLKPGESFVDGVTVTRFFDLSRPGTYTISVSRDMPPRQNLGNVSINSNAVAVTIVR